MLKKIVLVFNFTFFAALGSMAQSNDPVVMTVGGTNVTKSEFEYNFNKNNTDAVIDKKTVREYADLYAIYKMKVLEALDQKMDTISSYQKEFRQYRDQQIRPMLVPEAMAEQECIKYYNGMLKSLEGKELLKPAHIFVLLGQNATQEKIDAGKVRADSIYALLKAGADFSTLAKELSDDTQTARNGGELPWIGPGNTIKEFEDAAYSLKIGEMSAPVLSTVGYHIIKMNDRKQLEPFDTLHSQIHQFLERRGIREQLAGHVLDSLTAKYEGTYTSQQIMDMETERLCANDQDLKYLVKEYHDGLLLYDLCSQQIWEPAKADTIGLTQYFKVNRKKYAWTQPHFSGMIYYCKNQKDVAAVKKLLKAVPEDKWVATIRESLNKDSITVRMDKRLFAKGDNSNVDVVVFGDKTAKQKPMNNFPHVGYVGRILKKGPAKWTDISAQVVQDYQKAKEDEFVEKLRTKFPVWIDESLLSTVNENK